MNDYVAVILNGLFTGIGVILAHEFYDNFKEYHKRVNKIIKEVKNNVR
jgi:hypothetical protein